MIVKAIYSIDKLEESMSKFPDEIKKHSERRAAADLGLFIAGHFPFIKDVNLSWQEGRPVPDPFKMPITSAYSKAEDFFVLELAVIRREDYKGMKDDILDVLRAVKYGYKTIDEANKEVISALKKFIELER